MSRTPTEVQVLVEKLSKELTAFASFQNERNQFDPFFDILVAHG